MSVEPVVALEIGTSDVRALAGELQADGFHIFARGECESVGMRKGEVVDAEQVKACVAKVVQQLEKSGEVEVGEVCLAVTGAHIESFQKRGQIATDGIIKESDMHAVQELAKKTAVLPEGREVIHYIFQQFDVDGNRVVNPIGMEGDQLGVEMLVLHGVASRIRNIVKVIRDLDLTVSELMFGGLCAAQAALTPEQKQLGVLLIDLGGGTTDYVVYANEVLADAGVIGVGGDHVTNDLASAFRLTNTAAEKLKLEHGDASIQMVLRNRRVELAVGAGEHSRTAKLSDVQTVIRLRMEELFNLIRERLQENSRLSFLGAGVVLTGGGAHLKNVAQLAEQVFGLPCTVAHLHQHADLSTPEYATEMGLLIQGMKNAQRRGNGGLLGGFLRLIGIR